MEDAPILAKVLSAAVLGIEAYEVEVDLASGLAAFLTVGLPDSAVKESRDWVAAAIKNTGYPFPLKRITVNLAPLDERVFEEDMIKKEGPRK